MRLKFNDFLIIFSILMFLGAHTFTQLVINDLTSTTLASRTEQLVEAVEASPTARVTLQLGMVGFILRFILTPALIGGIYYGTRCRKFKSENDKAFTLGTMSMFFFLASLFNFINDLSVLVSII